MFYIPECEGKAEEVWQILSGKITCLCLTRESPRAHVAKFYDRVRLIRNVLRASKFFAIKLIGIVILWIYYTIPFGFSLFWHFRAIIFNLWIYSVWLMITDDGSLPEMRIWSLLIIKSDFKWCVYFRRSLYLYFYYLVSVTADGPESPRGHM